MRETIERRDSDLVYLRHALVHVWHLPLVVASLSLALMCSSLAILLATFVPAELMLLGVLPKLRPFRRWVDQHLDELERERATKTRGALLLQMGQEHRLELEQLESVLDRVRALVQAPNGGRDTTDLLGFERLTGTYARLAIAYRAGRDGMASLHRQTLEHEAHALRATARAGTSRTRLLAQQRLVVAERRLSRWDRSRDELEAIAHQLALIAEVIHLIHEQCLAPADQAELEEDIRDALGCVESNEEALREIAALSARADCLVDGRVLELGRTPNPTLAPARVA
jgi:hypothetical protein